MSARREAYAERAIPAVARLLTLLDRNPHSPTYGCFHRDYWLYKTSDFPDAVRQFGVHVLALVYKHEFPESPYMGQVKVRDWCVAALDFWAGLQHADGSFDEFYPYERGWCGPTAFTTFTVCEAMMLLGGEVPGAVRERVTAAVLKAAHFIGKGESEEDHLANHHAMSCLAIWKAYEMTGDESLKPAYERVWKGFLAYHQADEGWSREYDGVDPGYLSATVSFLGKIYQSNGDPRIREIIERSAGFCAYFIYPNGFYAGSLGSRNTQHFYPHGFEILAREAPLAAALAERALAALDGGGLVPPEIMSDRYVFYRVPELLQAFLDYAERPAQLPPLPYERENFTEFFEKSRIFAAVRGQRYVIANLAKGGVIKVFDRANGELVLADNGILGRLEDGTLLTSQWIDADYVCEAGEKGFSIAGRMQAPPPQKVFSLFKNLVFRGVLFVMGWSPGFCHFLKGKIRDVLILGQRAGPARFERRLDFEAGEVVITDEVSLDSGVRLSALSFGDDTFVRYVPQSRFFQRQELETSGYTLDPKELADLNRNETIRIEARTEGSRFERKVLE